MKQVKEIHVIVAMRWSGARELCCGIITRRKSLFFASLKESKPPTLRFTVLLLASNKHFAVETNFLKRKQTTLIAHNPLVSTRSIFNHVEKGI